MRQSVRTEDVLNLIRQIYTSIEPYEVYYALKAMKVKFIRKGTIDLLRWCIAVRKAGFPITTTLLSSLTGIKRGHIGQSLHILGDKGVLLLLKYQGRLPRGGMRWIINPIFEKYLPERLRSGE